MQSSTTLLCRALVMLTCLIVLPLVALFGTSLPQVAGTLLDRRVGQGTAAAKESLDAAPAFVADGAAPGMTTAPPPLDRPRVNLPDGSPTANLRPGAAPAGPPNAGPGAQPFPQPGFPPNHTGMVPVGYDAPAGNHIVAPPAWRNDPSINSSGGFVTDGRVDGTGAAPARPAALVPVAPFSDGPPRAAVPVAPERLAAGADGSPSSASGAFLGIQERLRGLGATYYRLESWGSQQPLFRFQCEAALDGSPHLTQHFESTDGDPLQAMGKVLAEVEAWKAGR
jgi:hypothetical protein